MRLIDADALLTEENYEKYMKDILIEGGTAEMYIRPKDVADLIADAPTIARIEMTDNKRVFVYEWEIDLKDPDYFPDKIKINGGVLTAVQEVTNEID